jgi:hypothetical protein
MPDAAGFHFVILAKLADTIFLASDKFNFFFQLKAFFSEGKRGSHGPPEKVLQGAW